MGPYSADGAHLVSRRRMKKTEKTRADKNVCPTILGWSRYYALVILRCGLNHLPHGSEQAAVRWRSLLHRLGDELGQGLGRGIIRQSQVVVELGVLGVLGAEHPHGHARMLQHPAQAKGLR